MSVARVVLPRTNNLVVFVVKLQQFYLDTYMSLRDDKEDVDVMMTLMMLMMLMLIMLIMLMIDDDDDDVKC